MTELTELGFVPNERLHGTMGISNRGHVVYGLKPSANAKIQAWVWLSEEDYLLEQGLHMLDDVVLPPVEAPLISIARDINDGFIVGHSAFAIGTNHFARR